MWKFTKFKKEYMNNDENIILEMLRINNDEIFCKGLKTKISIFLGTKNIFKSKFHAIIKIFLKISYS
jgi:hypothetical protein